MRNVILVIEDEILIRWAAVAALRNAGFNVIEAKNADSALSHLERHANSVVAVFTDVMMPGEMNGITLAHEIYRRWPAIRTIVTSGSVEMMSSALPPHGVFISKPYTMAHVIEQVRDAAPPAAED